jgi:hypothetical protein
MEVSGQLHALAALTPAKEPLHTNYIGFWVGPRDSLIMVVKRKSPIIVLPGSLDFILNELPQPLVRNVECLGGGMYMLGIPTSNWLPRICE